MSIILEGLDAAILRAEMQFTGIPGKENPMIPRMINWEEATAEEKETLKWKDMLFEHKKIAYKYRGTQEEQKEWMSAKLMTMFQYLLNHYSYEYAERFYNIDSWNQKFKQCGIEVEKLLQVPHCLYTKTRQCDFFCPYFDKQCQYKEG
jgi:hypothetical protein